MSKQSDTPKPYSEDNPDHVPNPLYQTGVVDTTGTTGDLGGRIETISPVFTRAKADAFAGAVEAIDDPDVRTEELVVLPEEDLTRDEAIQRVRDTADELADSEQLNTGLSPAQQEAAQTEDDGSGSTTNKTSSARKAAAGHATKASPAKEKTAADKANS